MSSVASKNPFALLDEAGDDSAQSSATPAKATATSATAPAPKKDNQKPRTGPASRGGKYYQRGGARSGSGLKEGAGNPNQNGIEEPENVPKKFEGRGRGRGGRGGPRGGRRPFDRHSATGKTDSDKKIHQGWGGDDGKTELQAEAAATTDAAAESAAPANDWDGAAADNWGGAPAEAGPNEGAEADAEKPESRPRKEEEEDNTLTLDQYFAQKKDKDSIIPKLEARKPNEGNDEVWKDAVALQKGGEEDAYFVGKTKTAPKARAKKEEKVYLEIDARFDRPSRGGRGRGGDRGDRGDRGERGGRSRGGRGGRGRGGNGGNAPSLDVADEAAFPSLS